jgi:hypothetical protein
MVKKSNRRGNSLVTNAPPTGRTTGASGGFDIVDGVAVPEDRSVRRFDGDELGSRFSTTIGGYNTGGIDGPFVDDFSGTSALEFALNTLINMYGGDASQAAFDQAQEQDYINSLLETNVDDSAGEWYDPDTGLVIPDFDPVTGKGMGTLFPVFYPDVTQTSSGGGGGGGDTAASAASSEAASAASAASSQADSGTGDWIYDADAGLFRESGGIETFIPVPGTYTDGQTISYGDAAEIFGEWGKNSTTNTATIPTSTSTATTTANSGASSTGLGLPSVLYLPDFGGADATGTLTLPTFTAGTLTLPTFTAGTGTTGTGTTGTGTTGTGTTGTGTTGTGTTGTGTTGTGAANLGGTGGGLSTGTGTGDGSGTGSGTGTGDGAGDGSGTGDGTGREQGEAQELADLLGGGGMRGVATEQAGVADITLMYDPSLSFAENMERMLGKKKNKQADAVDSALMYGGGIVQPTDLNDELLRIIGGR